MVALRPLTDWERMIADYGLMRLSPDYHPMALLRPHLRREPGLLQRSARSPQPAAPMPTPIGALAQLPDGARVECAGLVVTRQRPGTSKGFVFLLVEDETGVVNVVIPPDLYDRERQTVRGEVLVSVCGKLQRKSGTINLLAERVGPLQLPVRPPADLTGVADPLAAAAAAASGDLTVPEAEYRVANTQSERGSSNTHYTTHRLGVRVRPLSEASSQASGIGTGVEDDPTPAETMTLGELRLLNLPVHSFH